ncbi:MAG: hypothetical protein WCC60_00700, partial [Ilumatobacteraceae bacterium]
MPLDPFSAPPRVTSTAGAPATPSPLPPAGQARPSRRPSSAGRRWLLAGSAVLALGAGWLVLTRNGDDDRAGPTTAAATAPSASPVTASSMPTTVPPTSPLTTPPPTTLPPTTAAPTTSLALPTSDGLVAALPTAIDFPPDWTAPSSGPSTDPGPSSGPRKGFCGGGDAETRAVAAGMVAYGALP